MNAPPQCPIDNRLMLEYYRAFKMRKDGFAHVSKEANEIDYERQEHRRTCPVCKARMAYFLEIMKK